jgi:hypothetical protein
MLVAQLIALQAQAMEFMARSISNQSAPMIDVNVNRSNKLLRLHHETLEALIKYRKKGTQTMVVQHVHVNQGGKQLLDKFKKEEIVEKIKGQPHAKAWEMMWKFPRCQAKCRNQNSELCRNLAMANGRCRMQGGKSTGPKTQKGKNKNKTKNHKHGNYSSEALAEKKELQKAIKSYKHNIHLIKAKK